MFDLRKITPMLAEEMAQLISPPSIPNLDIRLRAGIGDPHNRFNKYLSHSDGEAQLRAIFGLYQTWTRPEIDPTEQGLLHGLFGDHLRQSYGSTSLCYLITDRFAGQTEEIKSFKLCGRFHLTIWLKHSLERINERRNVLWLEARHASEEELQQLVDKLNAIYPLPHVADVSRFQTHQVEPVS